MIVFFTPQAQGYLRIAEAKRPEPSGSTPVGRESYGFGRSSTAFPGNKLGHEREVQQLRHKLMFIWDPSACKVKDLAIEPLHRALFMTTC